MHQHGFGLGFAFPNLLCFCADFFRCFRLFFPNSVALILT